MKQRLISAVIALAIVIPLLIFRGIPFAIGAGLLALLGYKEIIELKESHSKIPVIVKILGILALLLLVYSSFDEFSLALGVSYWAIASSILILLLPTIFYDKYGKYTTKDALYLLGGVLLLGIFFNSLILLVNYDVKYLIFLLLITVMTDTFAYVVGMLIGKHKMIPNISPKKSWEGAVGGTVMGTFIASIFYINMINADVNLFKLILIVMGLSIIGQLGDLFFSKIKRENNIKDFSNIMPGHGGILDRLDSLVFVLLAFIIVLNIL